MFVLKSFCFYFVLTLASVFKSVTKCFLKTLFEKSVSLEKFDYEQVPTSVYLLEKRMSLFSFPLDNAIPLLVSR